MGAPHQVVTGNTANIPLGPWINGLLSYRMGKVGMPFVAVRTQGELVGSKKEPVIRAVAAMTRAALSLFDQGVFMLILLVCRVLLGVLMAVKAYLDLFCLFHVALIRCVGAVAVHAKHTLLHMAIYFLEILP